MLFMLSNTLRAQLQFPNGKSLNIFTLDNHIYTETEIRFYTGKQKITDYRFQKLTDSVDKNWRLLACINGYCMDRLTDTGSFKNDLGINDSTGFIRVHVFTNDSGGSAQYSYRIINKTNPDDYGDINVKIANVASAIKETQNTLFNIYPNPAIDYLLVQSQKNISSIQKIKIIDILGKEVMQISTSELSTINITQLPKGVYYLIIQSHNTITTQKIIKQ